MTVLVVKVTEDANWSYYAVRLCMLRLSNVGNYFACDMAATTLGLRPAELVSFLPTTGVPKAALSVDILNQKLEIRTDLGAPGTWRATRTDYVKEGWSFTQVTWELGFETSFCWETFTTAAVWKIPTGCEAFIEVFVDFVTASGGCAAKRTDQELTQYYVRAPIGGGALGGKTPNP
jgi:hypothetical protein